jgi:hypothetical protein
MAEEDPTLVYEVVLERCLRPIFSFFDSISQYRMIPLCQHQCKMLSAEPSIQGLLRYLVFQGRHLSNTLNTIARTDQKLPSGYQGLLLTM